MIVETLFALGLLVGVALAHWQRCPLLLRAAYVLAFNRVLCGVAVASTGDYAPVGWFAMIDFVSAAVLLLPPAGKTQSAIGIVYIIQLALHCVQWPGGVGDYAYLSVLTVGGSLQIAFLIVGAIDGDGRRKVRGDGDFRGGDHRVGAPGAARLARRKGP
jgi:hypothetical protein